MLYPGELSYMLNFRKGYGQVILHEGVDFFLLRMMGFLPTMFEASSLQLFKLGRIEHLRTVTNESVAFIKAFMNKDVKVCGVQ